MVTRCRPRRSCLSQSVLNKVDVLFQSALLSSARSVLLRLFLAHYVRWYRNNSYVEMLHLKALDQVRMVAAV